MLSTLRHRGFRWLWIGQTASAIGDQLFTVAIAALVVDSGRGAGSLGLVLGALALGLVLFSPIAGVIADRLPRRTVMAAADIVRGSVVLVIALLPDTAPVLVLAGLGFVVGGGEAFFRPAYQGLLPRILGSEQLQGANAMTALSAQTSILLGPGLAGLLIVVSGPSLALFADAVTFGIALLTLLGVSEDVPERRPSGESMLAEALEGLQAVRERPWIALIVLMAMVQLLFVIGPWEVLMPVVAAEELGGIEVYGWLLSIFGIGAVAGGFLAGAIRPRMPGTVAMLGLIPFGLMMFALAGPAPVWLIAVSLVAMGIGEQIFTVLWVTAIQRDVPDRLLSRVFSLDWLGSLALLPLGLALAGPATDLFGRDEVLVAGGVVAIATTLPLLLLPSVRRFSSSPEPPPLDPRE